VKIYETQFQRHVKGHLYYIGDVYMGDVVDNRSGETVLHCEGDSHPIVARCVQRWFAEGSASL
jgi:hypothetical protein